MKYYKEKKILKQEVLYKASSEIFNFLYSTLSPPLKTGKTIHSATTLNLPYRLLQLLSKAFVLVYPPAVDNLV